MTKEDKRVVRDIYQRMAAPERQLIERAMLMDKSARFGLIAQLSGLSDEEQEFLFNLKKLTNDDVAEIIAYAARGWFMRILAGIFGF